jgi:HlyD family secretion protein
MRRLFRWLLLLGALAGAAVAISVPVSSWLQRRFVPRYLTAPVSRGRVETVVNSTGTIKPVRTVTVGAFTSGPIERVLVDFNSAVTEGQEIARIDQKLAIAALARDRAALDRDCAALHTQMAELARVEALLEQAQNNEDRARKLVAINKDYLSGIDQDQYLFTRRTCDAQVELAKANVAQAEANFALSEANVANSETNLGYTRILAPEAGIVIERKVDKGQTVAASFQTPELFIIAPEMEQHMYVFASVDEADIGLIRAAQSRGQDVKFTVDAYPGDLFTGKIAQIRKNSTTTQNVVTYPVVIEAPNPDLKLMPGMTASLSFPIDSREDVLRVPVAALRFLPQQAQVHPDDWHYLGELPNSAADGSVKRSAADKAEQARRRQHRLVWVQEGPLLRAVPVTLGLIETQFAEVVGGELTEGQALVTGTESPLAQR